MGHGVFLGCLFFIFWLGSERHPTLSSVRLIVGLILGLQDHSPPWRHCGMMQVEVVGLECEAAKDCSDGICLPIGQTYLLDHLRTDSLDLCNSHV